MGKLGCFMSKTKTTTSPSREGEPAGTEQRHSSSSSSSSSSSEKKKKTRKKVCFLNKRYPCDAEMYIAHIRNSKTLSFLKINLIGQNSIVVFRLHRNVNANCTIFPQGLSQVSIRLPLTAYATNSILTGKHGNGGFFLA